MSTPSHVQMLTSISGVDATIADESTYLSHVFGLRAAGTARSASNTTNSSNTTRSTSSGDRPLVERDPYQNIGIRKGVAADRLSGVGHGNEVSSTRFTELANRISRRSEDAIFSSDHSR